MGFVDTDGFIKITGRKKEMIIVGGENVYAAEVEAVLCAHPRVAEAAVVGVPATGLMAWMGELVQAFVVPRPNVELNPRELQAFCVRRLASYKVPQRIAILDALPKNTLGKVVKRRLVEEG
jgi:long-chain acyl-CoA synthetase